MLTFDGIWHFGEVFSSQMNPVFYCTGQMADSVYGVLERFANVNVVDRVAHVVFGWGYGMGRRMLWTTNTGALY